MSNKIVGNSSGNIVEVDSAHQILISPEKDVLGNPGNVGGIKTYYENDDGSITGTPELSTPEVDQDYRLKTSNDTLLDSETFNYTAQNTSKHTYGLDTLAFTWSTAGLLTNSGSITTIAKGATMGTYAEFPCMSGHSVYWEIEGGFSNQPVANAIIDFGPFRRGATPAFAPADGAYFRLSSSGMQGVVNYNGTETITNVFKVSFGGANWTYNNNHKYQFIITTNLRVVQFWIDGTLYGEIPTQDAQGQPFMSSSLPMSIRHAHVGTAGGVIQFNINSWSVLLGGAAYAEALGARENAILGAYQGLSGGTMGQLVSGTVTTGTLVKPTAAVPANNALTANLGTGLGGRSWETYTTPLATNTDGVVCAYQNPAGTISVQGRRLRISGVKMSGVIQTVMTGGPFTQEWYLIFGGTAISLQTTEAATTKPCRRIMLPEFTQNITATQAVQTPVQQPSTVALFDQPIYVNPGEFVGLANNWFGTAPTAGVIAYTYQFIYSWE